MTDHKIDYSAKTIRDFALIMAAMLPTIFGLLLPWLWGFNLPSWPWIGAAVFALLGLTLPKTLLPVYFVWMKLALVLGWINTRLLLGLIFFALIVPMGIAMRLFGKDPMARAINTDAKSYRVDSPALPDHHSERPF